MLRARPCEQRRQVAAARTDRVEIPIAGLVRADDDPIVAWQPAAGPALHVRQNPRPRAGYEISDPLRVSSVVDDAAAIMGETRVGNLLRLTRQLGDLSLAIDPHQMAAIGVARHGHRRAGGRYGDP